MGRNGTVEKSAILRDFHASERREKKGGGGKSATYSRTELEHRFSCNQGLFVVVLDLDVYDVNGPIYLASSA